MASVLLSAVAAAAVLIAPAQAAGTTTGTEMWTRSVPATDSFPTAGPTVVNGKVFVTSPNELSSFEATSGDPVWSASAPGLDLYAAPVVHGGLLFYARSRGIPGLVALHASDGHPAWTYAFTDSVAVDDSLVVANGLVYVVFADFSHRAPGVSFTSKLLALNATTGAEMWQYTLPAWTASDLNSGGESFVGYVPTLATSEGLLFAGAYDEHNNGSVLVLNAATGALKQDVALPGGPLASALAGSDGTAYALTTFPTSELTAISGHTGTTEWSSSVAAGGPSPAGPTLADGSIYVSNSLGQFESYSAETGALTRTYLVHADPAGAMTVANGAIYYTSATNVDAVSVSGGHERWTYRVQPPTRIGDVVSAPTVVGGIAYVTTFGGLVEAITGPNHS